MYLSSVKCMVGMLALVFVVFCVEFAVTTTFGEEECWDYDGYTSCAYVYGEEPTSQTCDSAFKCDENNKCKAYSVGVELEVFPFWYTSYTTVKKVGSVGLNLYSLTDKVCYRYYDCATNCLFDPGESEYYCVRTGGPVEFGFQWGTLAGKCEIIE